MLLTEYNEQAHLQSEREIAIEEGKQIGANQLGKLISALLSEGRTEDAARAATDEAFRGQMYEKYGIKNESLTEYVRRYYIKTNCFYVASLFYLRNPRSGHY